MPNTTFVKFSTPDITGSSRLKGYEGWSEVQTWGFAGEQPTSAFGGGLKQVKLSPLTFTRLIDRASDDLLSHLCSGKPIGKVELHCFTSAGSVDGLYLKLTLEKVIVAGYEIAGRLDSMPVETVQLNYAKITWCYLELGVPASSITYDLVQKLVS